MESWLIRRRGGKPIDKPITASPVCGGQGSGVSGTSPKFKRKLDEGQDSQMFTRRKTSVVFAQRKLYSYPKEPAISNYLIPIRLDVDIEGYRYIDSFSWNLYEKDYTFETFAAALVRDLDLPECFYKKIAESIHSQVELARRSLPWDEAVRKESIHPICINIRLNDTILIDRFEVCPSYVCDFVAAYFIHYYYFIVGLI
jgi:SWI/SNF-related matrix-associated actin-dependent regulator of chromatin subfamily B protein 1